MGKKYDHLSMIDESGRVIQTESGSVTLENALGYELEAIATSSGDHATSYKRVVPVIKGNMIMEDGRKLSDLSFTNRRITLKDSMTGNRIICHKCSVMKLGTLGSEKTEYVIAVLGQRQEL